VSGGEIAPGGLISPEGGPRGRRGKITRNAAQKDRAVSRVRILAQNRDLCTKGAVAGVRIDALEILEFERAKS
jgi:hypothetical protein